jgi:hypothetical protein
MGTRYIQTRLAYPVTYCNTQVPRLDQYNETQQLHGTFTLRIKEEHTCQQHLGENGSVGHCYVTQGGRHIGLNMRRLSLWAAACVCFILIS